MGDTLGFRVGDKVGFNVGDIVGFKVGTGSTGTIGLSVGESVG